MKGKLERRVEYFFSSRYRHRRDVRIVLEELRDLGRVVLIGGMLRDLAVLGNSDFRSDVDLVIAPRDREMFQRRVDSLDLSKNRFGGYSWPAGKWRIDVWVLRETWASVMGHVDVECFEDLVETTFFDFDAIIYKFESKELFCPTTYFERLKERVFGINLRSNPNPVGNAVRAFRHARRLGFKWSPELTKFVAQTVEDVGWVQLMRREEASFGSRYIGSLDTGQLERDMQMSLSSGQSNYFDLAPYGGQLQLSLPLDNE